MILRDALGAPLLLPPEGDAPRPSVGDLWVLSADGQDRGLVLVSAVRNLYVLAWPVTLPSHEASAPAFLVEVPGVSDYVVWPDAEFGLSMAALDRRLARVLDDKTVRAVRWTLTDNEPVDGVATCPASDSPEADAAFAAVCSQAWALGEWSWPDHSVGNAALSQSALAESGVEIADLARVLAVQPGRASALGRGVAVPTREEVALVRSLFPDGTADEDFLEPVDGDEALVLSLPEYKARVRALSEKERIPERRARTMVWGLACARAARQGGRSDPRDAARARVEYVLSELLDQP